MITIADIKRYFDKEDISYESVKDTAILHKELSSKSHSTYAVLIVVEDEGYADVILSICRFSRNNLTDQLKDCINDLNEKYRFFKVYHSELSYNEYDIRLQAAAIVKENDSPGEILELIYRGISMADEIYPVLQRAMWQ